MASDDKRQEALREALDGLRRARARIATLESAGSGPLAICGVGLRLPGGVTDLDALEAAACADAVLTSTVPRSRWAAEGTGADFGGFLDDVYAFDPGAFGISPREVRRMDPAQRLLLMGAREAIATAGASLPERTGVYVATGLTDFAQATLRAPDPAALDAWSATGVLDSVQAGRLSYVLGLSGPAIAVDTACSGGLVALHLAARDLQDATVDAALVGAANVLLRPDASRAFAAMGALSPSGRCRPLSPDADGYVRSEAMVVLLMTRLADATAQGWPVLGVVHGTAVNQDGRSNGLTAPRGPAQTAVVRAALRRAGVPASRIGLVGMHGTGTPLGDPIEATALAEALGEDGPPVVIQASKARFGHAEPAAGLVSVVDALLALRRGRVPSLPGLERVSDPVAAAGGRLVWPVLDRELAEDLLAGVSAFGLAGTNAHAILGRPPAEAPSPRAHGLRWSLVELRPEGEAETRSWPGYTVAWTPVAVEAGGPIVTVDGADPEAVLREMQGGDPLLVRIVAGPDRAGPAESASAALARVAIAEGRPVGLVWGADAPAVQARGRELWWQDGTWTAPERVTAPVGPPGPASGRWWVVGGTGSLGRWLVERLKERGASEVVRGGRRDPGNGQPFVAVDLDDPTGLDAALAALGPVDGVVVVAGSAEDALLDGVSDASLARALRRAETIAALSWALPDADVRVVGTASEELGVPGQAVYAAWAAAVAASVRGTVVRFGPFDRGLAEAAAAALSARGVGRLPVQALDALFAERPPHGVLQLDAARWVQAVPSPRVRTWLGAGPAQEVGSLSPEEAMAVARAAVGEALESDPASLDPTRGLFDLGLDSMSAVLLAQALARRTGRAVSPTVAFEHPDLASLARWLAGGQDVAAPVVASGDGDPLVITGFAGRFPGGARTAAALYDRVAQGRPAIVDAPRDRYDGARLASEVGAAAVRGGFLVEDVYAFDPVAHGLSPREARLIDPAQRLLLDLAVEALADAGRAPEDVRDGAWGVFVGIDDSEWGRRLDDASGPDDRLAGLGIGPAFAAGRVAHRLGTTGPAITLDTACSSSLVALAAAADAIRAGRAEAALVGAAHLILGATGTRRLAGMRALSDTGRCTPFSEEADGFVRGEGAGVLVLERLSAARAAGRPVRAVLRGIAVGHDGPAASLTSPNARAQEAVQRAALAQAGVSAAEVGWLEAHGTGTRLGDPVELTAVAAVHAGRREPLHVTSCKATVGHLEAAAGMASLAVVLEGLRRGRRPGLSVPVRNPDLPDAPVVFASGEGAWTGPRVAAISSFGMSGTNAHVVLSAPEEGLAVEPSGAASSSAGRHLEVPWVSTVKERVLMPVTPSVEDPGEVRWIVPGDGARPGGLGLLRRLPAGAAVLDRVMTSLPASSRQGVRRALAGDGSDPDASALARFTFAVGLGRSLRALGLPVASVCGHGEGAIAAAVLSGAWSLEDGLAVLRARRAGLGALPIWPAFRLPVGEGGLPDVPDVHLRAVHGSDAVLVSVAPGSVDALVAAVPGALRLPDLPPAHTAIAGPVAEGLAAAVLAVRSGAATLPWRDPATGEIADPGEASRWVDGVQRPVRLDALVAGADTVVELASRPTLQGELTRLGVRPLAVGGRRGAFEATVDRLAGGGWRPEVWAAWRGEDGVVPVVNSGPEASEPSATSASGIPAVAWGIAGLLAGLGLGWWLA